MLFQPVMTFLRGTQKEKIRIKYSIGLVTHFNSITINRRIIFQDLKNTTQKYQKYIIQYHKFVLDACSISLL